MGVRRLADLQPGTSLRIPGYQGLFTYKSSDRTDDSVVMHLISAVEGECDCYCEPYGPCGQMKVAKLVFEDGRIETFSNYEG